MIPKFIRLMRAGEPPTIYGDGSAARDFTHVADVVDANIAPRTRRTAGLTINVATGISHTLLELVATLNELMGSNSNPSTLIPDGETYW